MLTKIRKAVPVILIGVTIYSLFKFKVYPKIFPNYTDLISSLIDYSMSLIGLALGVLGAINIFKDYAFIKTLFQLNVDLGFTKRLLRFVSITVLFSLFLIGAFAFDKDSTSQVSRIYIGILFTFAIQILWQISYIAYFILKVFKVYFQEEIKLRKEGK